MNPPYLSPSSACHAGYGHIREINELKSARISFLGVVVMFACSGPLTVSRPGFFFDPLDRGGGGGGSGSPPIYLQEYKSYSNETSGVYRTSEMVFFEVHIIS